MDKCKKCQDGDMVLKTENEELHYRGKPLVVPLAYHECDSCGFDIVSHELMVERNAIVKEAKRKAMEDIKDKFWTFWEAREEEGSDGE